MEIKRLYFVEHACLIEYFIFGRDERDKREGEREREREESERRKREREREGGTEST